MGEKCGLDHCENKFFETRGDLISGFCLLCEDHCKMFDSGEILVKDDAVSEVSE
jgi:hypothetical protein